MKWVVVAGFLLCIGGAVDAAALKCTPGDAGEICTSDNKVLQKSDLLPGKECLPGTQWASQCNQCTCDSEGLASCTEMQCGDSENKQQLRCAPDSFWRNECNTCWCTSIGHAMCTKIGCNGHSAADFNPDLNSRVGIDGSLVAALKASINQTKAVVCAANRMFVKDCNTCWCNEDGTSYFCTRKVCVPELPDEIATEENPEDLSVIKRQCRPDEVFELDCNMCRCNPDGKSFSCTRRACVPEEDKNTSLSRKARASSQEVPKTCQPDSQFRLDCNKCLCDAEGQTFSCTRIDCVALNNNNNGGTRRKRQITTQVKQACDPGSVFQQGCKVCKCAEDGRHAICPTRCQNEKEHTENDISDPDSDPSFRCNPGEQFKRACNDCTCSADGKGFFCTLRLCEEDITPSI